MPRDASGNYTLPVGNPVVSNTQITATWGNTTMADLGQAMTDSLSRSGDGGMLVPFKFADGSAGNPSQTFTNEPNSGMYLAGNNDVRYAIAGVDVARFIAGKFQTWDGAAWRDVSNTNLYLALTGGTVTGQIKGITPVAVADLTRKDYVDMVGDEAVKLTGDQTVSNIKTFNTPPRTAAAPTVDDQLTRKGYVDGQVETRYKGNISGIKTINVSTGNPSGGVNGDLWIKV